MTFTRFSKKQLAVLRWWADEAFSDQYQAVICDGAVRSGKTSILAFSFALWALETFPDGDFALCGKTIGSVKRNITLPLKKNLGGLCAIRERGNVLELRRGGRVARLHLFGGRDESSASLIQGMTLCGVLLDEVALMPRSFVEQALARCSDGRARFWFSCNPQGPEHWFYREWILKAEEKQALRLHFTMADNPSLSKEVRERYDRMYSGVFHRRYVMGEWVAAEGRVYSMFDPERHLVAELPGRFSRYEISCDYGTLNPFSAGLWGEHEGKWYRIREFYHDGRQKGQLTDEEYHDALVRLAGELPVKRVVVDPSAASFIQCIRKHGRFTVRKAKNSVLPGISHVAQLLKEEKLLFHESCKDTLREFSEYVWEGDGREQPRKENDHAMDDIRYFAETVVFGGSVSF